MPQPLGPKDPLTDWLVVLILALPLAYVAYLMFVVLWWSAVS